MVEGVKFCPPEYVSLARRRTRLHAVPSILEYIQRDYGEKLLRYFKREFPYEAEDLLQGLY